jgi:succinate-semialdehyde dehydrogenase/glutarate-semialdehyde dehydrogenase
MVAQAVACRISNGGERCNASKRFIVLDKHYDKFCQKMADQMAKLTVGDPMDPATDQPPLAKQSLLHDVHRQVTETVKQ